ncbi:PIG-L family deacetylase [Nonomuraea roseoviolacea subsp. roseoviolacea]|uniref:LmbE family N-acetylglucosaminyl deacetylase n=1 Tax=Nonomuraea roseoviolacea subsp. carminata TaxID=160689 RepID=A0ABT1KB64_9ACTN|nr:PIG-L family deacetylase [Nonomuraea roseoviolacea]MCP2351256.1 LmbE family N-acetylglucosaminyl deacetylase [Nonomuraea roseoviolacea subsp. carminata]
MSGAGAPVLVVSAHLDDAVLSWGGTIAALTRRGVRVVVVTVFAGCGGDPMPPFAALYHSWWRQAGADADAETLIGAAADTAAGGMRLRRQEDATACEVLGAEAVHLDFVDALYRRDAAGSPRCATGDDLFSAPGPDDRALEKAVIAALAGWIARLRPGELHAPAAVGGHLDHVLTAGACASALRSAPFDVRARWYEDLPYALESADPAGRGETDPSDPGETDLPGPGETETARPGEVAGREALGPAAVSRLTGDDWRRKIEAAAAYRSQHPMLWDDDWPDRLLAHAREIGGGTPAERFREALPRPNGDH